VASVGTPIYFTVTTAGNITITTNTTNPQGSLEKLPSGNTIGSNLVTNGTFDTDANWTKGGGATAWTIDAADSNKAEKGAGDAGDLASAATVATIAGDTYQVSFVATRTAGTLTPKIGAVSGIAVSAAGTYTQYIKAAASNATLTFSADAAFAGSLDTVTVKSVPDLAYLSPGTYTATSGSTATIPAEPRFETNGLLVEGEATNYVTYSCDFTNAAWTKSNITPLKNQTGPDGVANSASLLTAGAANGTALFTVADGGATANKTFSMWIKRVTGTGNIDLTDNNGTNWTTQSVTSTWTKFALAARSQAIPIVGIRLVTNTDAVAVCLAQNEISAFSTSAIPTNGCPVTRLTEAGSATNGYSWTMSTALKNSLGAASPSRGTLLVDWTPGWAATALSFDAGIVASGNQVASLAYNSTTSGRLRISDDTGVVSLTPGWSIGTAFTIASRWDSTVSAPTTGAKNISVKTGGTWSHGTVANYDGGFTLGTSLRLGFGNEYPFWISRLRVYDGWVQDANLDSPKKVGLFPILPTFTKVKPYLY
jgi:hypothetical protein